MSDDQVSDSPKRLQDFAGFLAQLAARGKSRAALRAALFRHLCVAKSAKYSSMPVVSRLDLAKNCSLSPAADFHHGLLEEHGFEFAVIGGQAVAAYARLMGEEVLSLDLDIYMTERTLTDLLTWAPGHGVRVVKRPQPRNIPVAFLEIDDKEINALTSSHGLRDPDVVIQTARNFNLKGYNDLEVPIADPFDILGNKLKVRRDKDLPHIEILRRFVEEEAVTAFREETRPRVRLSPARRLLSTLGAKVLPVSLADRLIELAQTPVDYRFLMGRVPTQEQAMRILEKTKTFEEELRRELSIILETRRFAAGE